MLEPMKTIDNSAAIEYEGFTIEPIFIYGDGRMDIQYYKTSDPEIGGMLFRGSIEKAKEEINEYIYENQD